MLPWCPSLNYCSSTEKWKTGWEREREKKTGIKEKESVLAASLCLRCHGRVKQTELRNCNPNRGHGEGRGRPGRERSLLWKKIASVFPSKSVAVEKLGLPVKWRNDSGSCTQFSACWQRGGFCLQHRRHSEQHRMAWCGMWHYCFILIETGSKWGTRRGQLRKTFCLCACTYSIMRVCTDQQPRLLISAACCVTYSSKSTLTSMFWLVWLLCSAPPPLH